MSGGEESYSIWLSPAPDSPLYAQLEKEMGALRAEYGGPQFQPHVTLLGDIRRPRDDVAATAQALAAQIKPYRINLLNVTRGTFYYQCVFALAARDEAVMAAGAAARRAYDMGDKPHMPHLSLLYADLDDAAKDKAASQARARLFGEGSSYSTLLTDPGFTVTHLQVWSTPTDDTSLQSWCKVADVPLSG
mmetsp:Transcript_34080/g.86256  ORF Transcript_34080/g.86256 Transcript_34080/m.86256 type:complete len:190 (-) Transcript_34080:418-987(-)